MSRSMMLGSAIRNAIAGENAAAALYGSLAKHARDLKAQQFFEEMAQQEREHAVAIEEMGRTLNAGKLPLSPNTQVKHVEAVPGWEGKERLSLAQAIDLALDAERGAELLYDTWADMFDGDLGLMFSRLSATEAQHAQILEELASHLSDGELAADVATIL